MTRVPTSQKIGWQQPVESEVSSLPTSTTKGKRHILESDKKIYTCIKAGASPEWEETVPKKGWYVFCNTSTPSGGYRLKYTGTKWVKDYQPASQAININGEQGIIYYSNHGIEFPVHAIFFSDSAMTKEVILWWNLELSSGNYRVRWKSNSPINNGRAIIR